MLESDIQAALDSNQNLALFSNRRIFIIDKVAQGKVHLTSPDKGKSYHCKPDLITAMVGFMDKSKMPWNAPKASVVSATNDTLPTPSKLSITKKTYANGVTLTRGDQFALNGKVMTYLGSMISNKTVYTEFGMTAAGRVLRFSLPDMNKKVAIVSMGKQASEKSPKTFDLSAEDAASKQPTADAVELIRRIKSLRVELDCNKASSLHPSIKGKRRAWCEKQITSLMEKHYSLDGEYPTEDQIANSTLSYDNVFVKSIVTRPKQK